MSLRTYLEAAWKDGKAPFDPSTLVINVLRILSRILPNLTYLVTGPNFLISIPIPTPGPYIDAEV
jgi:hypothetical protein